MATLRGRRKAALDARRTEEALTAGETGKAVADRSRFVSQDSLLSLEGSLNERRSHSSVQRSSHRQPRCDLDDLPTGDVPSSHPRSSKRRLRSESFVLGSCRKAGFLLTPRLHSCTATATEGRISADPTAKPRHTMLVTWARRDPRSISPACSTTCTKGHQ